MHILFLFIMKLQGYIHSPILTFRSLSVLQHCNPHERYTQTKTPDLLEKSEEVAVRRILTVTKNR